MSPSSTDPAASSAGSLTYDLVIVGGTAAGLSVAISSQRSGLKLVRIVESGDRVAFGELVGENRLDVGYGETVTSIDVLDEESLVVTTDRLAYRTRAALVADRSIDESWTSSWVGSHPRVRVGLGDTPFGEDDDVLVIGHTDTAVELTAEVAEQGARVVLAGGGLDPTLLSPAGDNVLRRLERERRATVLYRSQPSAVADVDGFPMVDFGDRRTPDLQFDHVVLAPTRRTTAMDTNGVTEAAAASGRVWSVGDPTGDEVVPTAPGHAVGAAIAEALFPEVDLSQMVSPAERRRRHTAAIDELRDEHYNATITHFEPTHSDLWVLRVQPDHGETNYLPGQYATLGLGFWEDRVDDATDPKLDERWDKLIRRSYSISSRMFDEHGYLVDEGSLGELEFYIVLVPPTPDNVPGLTPRLALKRPGDRIYLGPKVTGRYTLADVTDPTGTVVFLSTGTGEAPHNAMAIELLRKGHVGPIVAAVTARRWADFGYLEQHRTLAERYPNYHYVPLPTREDDVPKRYLQSLITDDVFGSELGVDLDPERTHVYLCGNPAMIGLPETVDGEERWPETVGVVQLLSERGFTIHKRNQPGNIHFEEYW